VLILLITITLHTHAPTEHMFPQWALISDRCVVLPCLVARGAENEIYNVNPRDWWRGNVDCGPGGLDTLASNGCTADLAVLIYAKTLFSAYAPLSLPH
jgi:hypothetical protein